MRFRIILTVAAFMAAFLAAFLAAFMAPAGIAASSVHAAGLSATSTANQFFAAKKKKKAKVKKNTDEYLKAAPGTGPSGPSK